MQNVTSAEIVDLVAKAGYGSGITQLGASYLAWRLQLITTAVATSATIEELRDALTRQVGSHIVHQVAIIPTMSIPGYLRQVLLYTVWNILSRGGTNVRRWALSPWDVQEAIIAVGIAPQTGDSSRSIPLYLTLGERKCLYLLGQELYAGILLGYHSMRQQLPTETYVTVEPHPSYSVELPYQRYRSQVILNGYWYYLRLRALPREVVMFNGAEFLRGLATAAMWLDVNVEQIYFDAHVLHKAKGTWEPLAKV